MTQASNLDSYTRGDRARYRHPTVLKARESFNITHEDIIDLGVVQSGRTYGYEYGSKMVWKMKTGLLYFELLTFPVGMRLLSSGSGALLCYHACALLFPAIHALLDITIDPVPISCSL